MRESILQGLVGGSFAVSACIKSAPAIRPASGLRIQALVPMTATPSAVISLAQLMRGEFNGRPYAIRNVAVIESATEHEADLSLLHIATSARAGNALIVRVLGVVAVFLLSILGLGPVKSQSDGPRPFYLFDNGGLYGDRSGFASGRAPKVIVAIAIPTPHHNQGVPWVVDIDIGSFRRDETAAALCIVGMRNSEAKFGSG
ncbi:hypothetical protein EDB85DRAFT_2273191 [Lactarius pseudohatsudake]|nr:hypothetical protein EDB85DRAFT_2273191 [Lactarius pseudohatsudake]